MSDTQRDREERQHVIEVLKSWDGYFIGYTSDEVQEALRYAIASIETDLRYDLLYEETSGQADKPTTKDYLGVDYLGVDAVSRQEVLDLIADYDLSMGQVVRGIHALPSVTPQEPKSEWEHDHEILRAYADGANNVLDKLRAEIDKLYEREGSSFDRLNALDELREFIDKYKAESEDT